MFEITTELKPGTSLKPTIFQGRQRVLALWEHHRLLSSAEKSRNPYIKKLLILSLETGLRPSERLKARWVDVDLLSRTLYMPGIRHGRPERVVLFSRAFQALIDLQPANSDLIFPITASAAIQGLRRLLKRAGLDDLRVRDLGNQASHSSHVSWNLENRNGGSQPNWSRALRPHRTAAANLGYQHALSPERFPWLKPKVLASTVAPRCSATKEELSSKVVVFR